MDGDGILRGGMKEWVDNLEELEDGCCCFRNKRGDRDGSYSSSAAVNGLFIHLHFKTDGQTVSEKRPLLWSGKGRHRSSLPINPNS